MTAKTLRAAGFTYGAAARANMSQFGETAFDRSLLQAVGGYGLQHWFDPADLAGGKVQDRADQTTWTVEADAGTADPTVTTINGKPALAFANGTTRSLASDTLYDGTSFTLVVAYSYTSGDAGAPGNRLLWSNNDDLNALVHTRLEPGSTTAQFHVRNDDTTIITFPRPPGTYVDMFSYDATTQQGVVLDHTGAAVGMASFPVPAPAGGRWHLGGWIFDTYAWGGKVGRVLIFNTALHRPENAGVAAKVAALFSGEYGLATS